MARFPRPKKSLGQHFLDDSRLLSRIVDALEPSSADVVLEIGAGRGSLTRALAGRVRRVIAIEKDRRLAAQCRWRMADGGLDNVQIVDGDALTLDWRSLIAPSAIRDAHWKVAGNIPYYITTPIIEASLLQRPSFMVFLVQEEVADRLVAPPGSKRYGALSVGVQAEARVEKLFVVKPGAFVPPPKVNSAVIRLRPLAEPLVGPAETLPLRRFVTACFMRRRKQLRNVLRGVSGRSAASVEAWVAAVGLDLRARPETLAPTDFVRLLRSW